MVYLILNNKLIIVWPFGNIRTTQRQPFIFPFSYLTSNSVQEAEIEEMKKRQIGGSQCQQSRQCRVNERQQQSNFSAVLPQQ
ncbi:hypothetical protein Glove_157g85 [Diversispora epigaea]|uniref:Uncharacterized protein n=1 Tax=Diversispora epigaea TaxID=1348612 RepID=A0A397IRV5_9GLOM|nr:hypothetical protein Glove_157g85 [Diversispora epigaea]